jgi:hypothetical protein
MYTCAKCKKEYKRNPRGAVIFADVMYLLCRKCKGSTRTNDNPFYADRDIDYGYSTEEIDNIIKKDSNIFKNLREYSFSSYRCNVEWFGYHSVWNMLGTLGIKRNGEVVTL